MTNNTAYEIILDTVKAELMELFQNNEPLFGETIEALDSWNGYLEDDRWYYMEDIDELFSGTDATEILTRAFFGYNADYTDKNGNHPEPFNPNADFFKFNGYGNLVSGNYKDYSDLLDEYFINEIIENAEYLNLDVKIIAILEALEECEEMTA